MDPSYNPPTLSKVCLDYVCKNFDDLALKIPKLTKELKDKLWKFMVQEKLLNDHRLTRFFDNQPIREIDLSGCDKISDASIIYLAKKFPSLQHANLSFCNLITQEGIRHLCTNCTQLQTISLFDCQINDVALIHIANSLPSLKSLTLAGCKNITDNAISKISTKCTELVYLDVSHCKSISSNSIKSICSSLSNLQHFDLSWCSEAINDSAIQKLAKCHKLQHIGLADTPKVSDSILQKIFQGCTKLASLDLSSCPNVFQSDKILKYLGGVHRLIASGCNISESTLGKILESAAPELRELDISYNDGIKEQWLQNMIANPTYAKNLRVINVCFCKGIQTKTLHQLQQARENLTIHCYPCGQ
eukprot:Phypoly_transcript_11005.p1 GENE.Phypoly_transcript_11005~~Phypoly_transcript_11005.p1  ORF type:complete len:360 (+),score=51.73 Phypoly_transcript_11005:124-1203(+)